MRADDSITNVQNIHLIEQNRHCLQSHFTVLGKGKGKTIPLQAWTGPEGSTRLRLPDFKHSAHGSGKVVSPTHRPPLPPPGNIPGTHLC